MKARRAGAPGRWSGAVIAAAVVISALVGSADVARAQLEPDEAQVVKEAPERVTTLDDLGFGDSSAFGAAAQLDFFFSGSGDYEIADGSRIVVDLTHSNLLDPEQSAVAIAFNDRPLLAVPLDETNITGGTYEIPVPADLIEDDFNQLTFTFNMTTGQFCESSAGAALFATVLGSTLFEMDFQNDPPIPRLEDPNLSQYPYPFFRAGYPIVAPVIIGIPDAATGDDLTAAYQLATGLAAQVFFELDLVRIRRVSDITPDEMRRHQLILVGTPQRNPLLLEALRDTEASYNAQTDSFSRNGDELEDDAGFLALVGSPWNELYQVMVVTGKTELAVRRGVDALTLDEPAALLAGPEAVLLEPVIPPVTPAFQQTFTFIDAGTSESTVQGQSGNVSVAFSAPAAAPDSAGQMDLVLSYPEGLDPRRSNIIVELNGETVATVLIDKEESHRTSFQVELPSDTLRIGPNTVSLQANLYFEESLVLAPCESPAPERLWLTIHDDSAIRLPQAGGVATGSNLGALPYPFAGLRGIRETIIAVNAQDRDALRAGMFTMIALGRAFGAQNLFTVQSGLEATPETLGDNHIIAIGVPSSSPLGQELERVLPLVLREGGSRALVEEEGTLTEILDSSRIGAIQEVEVPWAPGRALLSVSGTDSTALGWAADAIVDRSLDGNVALLQSATQINTFDLQRLAIGDPEEILEDRFTEEDSQFRTLLSIGLISSGAALVLLLYAFRGRIRPRFGVPGRRR